MKQNIMNLHVHRKGWFKVDTPLLDSKAFRSLSRKGNLVLLDFLSFVEWETTNSKHGKVSRMTNSDSLMYSFDEAKRRGIPYSTFNRALTELVERGFLTVKKHGSGLQNDPNVYAWSNEWKQWGTPQFKAGVRLKAKSGAGFRKGNSLGQRFHQPGGDGTVL